MYILSHFTLQEMGHMVSLENNYTTTTVPDYATLHFSMFKGDHLDCRLTVD